MRLGIKRSVPPTSAPPPPPIDPAQSFERANERGNADGNVEHLIMTLDRLLKVMAVDAPGYLWVCSPPPPLAPNPGDPLYPAARRRRRGRSL